MNPTHQTDVAHYRRGRAAAETETRAVVREAALVIRVDGQGDYVIMRTPGHDRELAVGFLLTEGLIRGVGDVALLAECQDDPNAIRVRLAAGAGATAQRNLVVNSSCGLCGRTDLASLLGQLQPVSDGLKLDVAVLYAVPAAVRQAQELFATTGATHAAALFDGRGSPRVVREDVGRHNALDKAIGRALLAGLPMRELAAFLSGRASLEMIVKAARAGIAVVAAISAPTDAAVEAARRLNIALCGFVRGEEVTVYAHGERLG